VAAVALTCGYHCRAGESSAGPPQPAAVGLSPPAGQQILPVTCRAGSGQPLPRNLPAIS